MSTTWRRPGCCTASPSAAPCRAAAFARSRLIPSVPWDDYVIVAAADIPGVNRVKLIADDQPYLASEVINHAEEPILLIAHADKARADAARRLVRIDVDPLPPVLSIDESLAQREIIWGTDNQFKRYAVAKGDVEQAFAGAPLIVEGVYETGAQEQLYIEPNGMIAVASPQHGRHRVGLDAVSLLHPQGADGAVRAAGRASPRRPDGDRRRLRRQGRVSRRSSPATRRCWRGRRGARSR